MDNRAIIYARVSTKKQGEEGASLAAQVEHCRRYAQDKGLQVIKEISETFSGTKLARPGLDEARDMIDEGKVDAFIVYSSDRFTRSVKYNAILNEEFDKAGVAIHFVTKGGPIENTPEGRFQQHIEGAFNELWRDKLIEAARRSKRHLAKHGRVSMGTPKYGYRNTKDHVSGLKIYEPEAAVVKRIFTQFAGKNRPSMSLVSIAQLLTSDGIVTPGGRSEDLKGRGKGAGAIWLPENIMKKIIKRREYIGHFQYKEFKHYYPELAIIDLETWEAAQKQIKINKQKAKRRGPAGIFPLTGRINCKCGHSMGGTSAKRGEKIYRYYRCDYQKRRDSSACDAKMLNADLVDDLAWQWLINLFMNQDRLDHELKAMAATANEDLKPMKRELEATRSQLTKYKAKIASFIDKFANEDDQDVAAIAFKKIKDLKRVKQDLEKHAAYLEARISAAEMTPEMQANIKAGISKLMAAGRLQSGGTAEDKKRFMDALAVKVELDESGEDRLLHITGGTGEIWDTFALDVLCPISVPGVLKNSKKIIT